MENKLKLQPVAVRTLGLPPEATAQLNAIARREETPDLDTEKEFKSAAAYLDALQKGVYRALFKARPIPAPSEGTTVFANAFVNGNLEQPFQYRITEGGRFKTVGDIFCSSEGATEISIDYEMHGDFYGVHDQNDDTTQFSDAVKLASDGNHVFAMVDSQSLVPATDFFAIRLQEGGDLFSQGSFEKAQIDSPEFEGTDGFNRSQKLIMEDLIVVDGQVCGVYWNPKTKSYLELPLKTEGSNRVADASDM